MPSSLSRTIRFHAEHHYWRPEWPAERNRATFGACSEAPGHGHDYQCTVTVGGPLDRETGMIMDLALLDRILAEEVTGPLDGRHFNRDVPPFAYGAAIPTGEAVATWLFGRIAARLPAGVRLERVRIAEDPYLYAECTGPD